MQHCCEFVAQPLHVSMSSYFSQHFKSGPSFALADGQVSLFVEQTGFNQSGLMEADDLSRHRELMSRYENSSDGNTI